MKIVVGSTNPVKINAVKRAFSQYFESVEVQGIKVDSKVSAQPLSAQESYQGAYNRAKACLENYPCDFGVGVEGGLEHFTFGTTTCGFIVILDRDGRQGVGTSARMVLPERYAKEIKKGQAELGHLVGIDAGDIKIKQKGGMFGLLSKGVVNREDAYFQGVVFALSKFVSEKFYKEDK